MCYVLERGRLKASNSDTWIMGHGKLFIMIWPTCDYSNMYAWTITLRRPSITAWSGAVPNRRTSIQYSSLDRIAQPPRWFIMGWSVLSPCVIRAQSKYMRYVWQTLLKEHAQQRERMHQWHERNLAYTITCSSLIIELKVKKYQQIFASTTFEKESKETI